MDHLAIVGQLRVWYDGPGCPRCERIAIASIVISGNLSLAQKKGNLTIACAMGRWQSAISD
jgi:hypothetical protein